MNYWFFLVCIAFIPTFDAESGDDSLESSTEEMLANLLQMIMDLTARTTALENQLETASILPPYSAFTFAICSGRAEGISGIAEANGTPVSSNEDLRCPSGSVQVVGENGERDISGDGKDPGPFLDILNNHPDFGGIDGCERECIDAGDCVAFNWIIADGKFFCELYDSAVPNDSYQPADGAIIFCAIDTEEPCEIGEIIAWGGSLDNLPDRYLPADGSTISETDYPELCGVINNICGDASCLLPNLINRFILGAGTAEICAIGGSETLPARGSGTGE